jgi:hypothetical protein
LISLLGLLDFLLVVDLLNLLGSRRKDNIVRLVSIRDFKSSISELFVEFLNNLLSVFLEIFLGGIIEGDLEDVFAFGIDSDSLSNNFSWINEIVEDLIVNR